MNLKTRVAIDSGPLSSGHSVRGIGVATRELLKEFGKSEYKDIQIIATDFSKEDLSKYDIVHYQTFRPFFLDLPFTKPAGKVVLTIHDLIPLIYPNHYPSGLRRSLNWPINRWLVRKNVDAIITISETSKKDICRFFGVSPSIVHVVRLAPVPAYKKVTAVKGGYPENFVFNYGDINYNKNIPTLVKACEILDIPLVIAGKQATEVENMNLSHAEHIHLKPILKALTDSKKVVRTGYVTDEEANKIYNLASVYVQPSFYEGFGLSVVNAFAAGCPVICAKSQALVELAEGACLLFDPKNPEDLADKIRSVIKNSEVRNSLIKKGYEIAKNLTWEKTANETIEVYRKIA